jgi:hypothetical protein
MVTVATFLILTTDCIAMKSAFLICKGYLLQTNEKAPPLRATVHPSSKICTNCMQQNAECYKRILFIQKTTNVRKQRNQGHTNQDTYTVN